MFVRKSHIYIETCSNTFLCYMLYSDNTQLWLNANLRLIENIFLRVVLLLININRFSYIADI